MRTTHTIPLGGQATFSYGDTSETVRIVGFDGALNGEPWYRVQFEDGMRWSAPARKLGHGNSKGGHDSDQPQSSHLS